MNSFEDSILRVLKGDLVVGAAFLVSDRLVATCAHVVETSGVIVGETISLRLSDGKQLEAIVEPEFWRNPSAEDISIIKLSVSIENIEPLVLGSSTGSKGHNFSTFGFPKQGQELSGSGEIIGQATINGIKLLQLRSPEVTPGFSGAPIFDVVTKRAVGMVVAITPPDEYQRLGTTAFAVPSEIIRDSCIELQISDICPYKSLDVFNEEDAPFFFGRERIVQKMIDSLKREPRFLAVLGPSGSGKSSVVRAGLIPALKKGKVPGSDKWSVITSRPANQPFEQLNSTGLSNSQDGLEGAVRAWSENHPDKTRLVVVIDQFEEVLVSTPEDIRPKFIKEIANTIDSPVAITIILTLRDDFYSRFLQDAAVLTSWLERGLTNIPTTLDEDELQAMVIEPANAVGLNFEEGLANVIISDAIKTDRTKEKTRSTILPLLEFALTQLWEKRRGEWLTHDAYHAMGGVTGGLTQWADRAYYSLTTDERETARYILSALVRLGDEAQGVPDTRRVRVLADLVHHNEPLSAQVMDQLVHVRLLSTWRDKEMGQEKIEIIHEALLKEWGLLRNWLTENRIFLAWRDGLDAEIQRWEDSNRDDGALLQGLQLIEAEQWLVTRKDDIRAIGQQFIKAGTELREKGKAERERLYEQTARQLKYLEALREVDLAIINSPDTQVILRILLETVVKQLNVDATDILLIMTSSSQLKFVSGLGFHTDSIKTPDFPLGLDLAGKVVNEKRMIHVPNLTTISEGLIRYQLLTSENFVSYFGVPLISKDQVKGVLEIFHRSALNGDPEWLNFLETLAGQAMIAIENASLFEDLQRSNQELLLAYDATIEGWSRALDLRDKETEGHTQRVTEMTLRMAQTMGLGEADLINIRRGALLHDIGKIGIPDTILLKPSRLTDEEWTVMRQHPSFAYEILSPIKFLRPSLDIPYCHHESWDGTGYPRGLKGEEIPLFARLFAIVETYDMLISDRPFQPGWSKEKTLAYISEQRGKHFDPALVDVFMKWIEINA